MTFHKALCVLAVAFLAVAFSACGAQKEYYYSNSGMADSVWESSAYSGVAGNISSRPATQTDAVTSASTASGMTAARENDKSTVSSVASSVNSPVDSSEKYGVNDGTAKNWDTVLSSNTAENYNSSSETASSKPENSSETTSPSAATSAVSSEVSSEVKYDTDSGWNDWVGL